MGASAEVQRLLATYEVQDKSSAGVASAVGGLGRLEGRGASVMSRLSGLGQSFGNAMGHAAGRLKQLATAGLGLLGVGGILGIGGLLKSGIDEARDFGSMVSRLISLTGLGAEQVSALASAFHHFGIESDTVLRIAGFTEKTLGNLTLKRKSELGFFQDFGIELRRSATSTKDLGAALDILSNKHATHRDRLKASALVTAYFKGQVKDFNEVLLTASDFFNNKAIPAQVKNAALAKLFGKNWAELIPVLKAGRKGISDAEAEAKRLGLTLTKDNIEALKKSKEATRDFGTALGGLKLQIGLGFIPLITDMTKKLTGFVVDHRGDIISFFRNLADFIGTVAGAASRIPSGLGITDMIKGAIAAWDRLPDGLRDWLVKGIVADRTVKFLFGFSPIGTVGSAIGSAISSALGSGIGKVIGNSVGESLLGGVQKVFVVNPGFGAGGGGLPGLPAAGAAAPALGLGALAVGLAAVTAFGVAVGLVTKAIDDRLGVTPINLREQQFNRTQQNLTPDNPRVTTAIREEAERLRQAINTGFHKDVAGSLEDTRHAIIATGEKDRAKATAIVTSLENQRHSMLSKQSTANGLLTRIANKKTNVHITIPVNNNIRAVISGNNAYHTTTINGVVTPLDL